jgi:hypothetical protein
MSLIVMFSSCYSTARFPISDKTPAADMTAKKRIDKQKNYTLEINVKNLASSDRLNPPGSNYSVWIMTVDNEIKNVGQLNVKNAKKTNFKTVTPYDFNEIFITVENKGDSDYPVGIEIARTKIRRLRN